MCGTSEGVLLVYNWGEWDGASDCFPGHPSSVETLLKLDESTILTGSSGALERSGQARNTGGVVTLAAW